DRRRGLPFLDPRPDEAEELGGAAERMAHERIAGLLIGALEAQADADVLGGGAAHAELFGEVVAERAGDEEQGFAVLDGIGELAVRARVHRWAPGFEAVRLEPAGEEDGAPSGRAELALELALADRRDVAEGSQPEEVEPLRLLGVEQQLAR